MGKLMLYPEHLKILADCQSQQTAAATNIPFLADDNRGRQSIVPPGMRWMIHRIDVQNSALDFAAAAYVWIVPKGEGVSSSTTTWTIYPGNDIAVGTTVSMEPHENSQVVAIMEAGDSIWIMGGATDINLRVIGWEIPA